jgi:hypothetical protein
VRGAAAAGRTVLPLAPRRSDRNFRPRAPGTYRYSRPSSVCFPRASRFERVVKLRLLGGGLSEASGAVWDPCLILLGRYMVSYAAAGVGE